MNESKSLEQKKDEELLALIAAHIKELRRKKGITQEVFYFDTNIHIARVETGRLNISVSTMFFICSYLGVNMSDFFKMIEEKKIE